MSFAWEIQHRKGAKLPRKTSGIETFDADAIGSKLVIRHWRPGDRFQPIGLARTAKLQDLFVNQKIPREVRRELMIAASSRGDIFWVEGLRISERFKLTKSTIRRLHWAWQRL
jgi:tRNA(Ile)-lysidine synthase